MQILCFGSHRADAILQSLVGPGELEPAAQQPESVIEADSVVEAAA